MSSHPLHRDRIYRQTIRAKIHDQLSWRMNRAHALLEVNCLDAAIVELDEARRLHRAMKSWPQLGDDNL